MEARVVALLLRFRGAAPLRGQQAQPLQPVLGLDTVYNREAEDIPLRSSSRGGTSG